jgi:hypothetical protein
MRMLRDHDTGIVEMGEGADNASTVVIPRRYPSRKLSLVVIQWRDSRSLEY